MFDKAAALAEHTNLNKPIFLEREAAIANFHAEWDAKRQAIAPVDHPDVSNPDARAALAAKEMAAALERHEAARYRAAGELDKVLPTPMAWHEFLAEKCRLYPNDADIHAAHTVALDEREVQPSISGSPLGLALVPVTLSDLSHKVLDDGKIAYSRGLFLCVKDVGPRLDVMRPDPKDIEAAMRIAAYKFDPAHPLTLAGSEDFKVEAAKIAARLGLQITNQEESVKKAFRAEKDSIEAAKATPEIAQTNSVEGVEKELPDNKVLLHMPTQEWVAAAESAGYKTRKIGDGDDDVRVEMDSGRHRAAHHADVFVSYTSLSSVAAMQRVVEAASPSAEGFLSPDKIAILAKTDKSLVEDGKLTPHGVDWLIARVSKAHCEDIEKQQKAEKQAEQKRIIFRNIDQQSQSEKEKHDAEKTAEKSELAHKAEKAVDRADDLEHIAEVAELVVESQAPQPGRINVPMPRKSDEYEIGF